jgi:hypothetical protein
MLTHKGEATDKYPQLFENLVTHFELPEDAARFVIMIEQFSQFFDDVADGDEIKRADLDRSIYNCFIGLNLNSFFLNHRLTLLPVMDLIILKWQGSDIARPTSRFGPIHRCGYECHRSSGAIL